VPAVVVPSGGVDGVREVVTEARRENSRPTPDLFKPLLIGLWHKRDGHPLGAEAPPIRQVHVVPSSVWMPVVIQQLGHVGPRWQGGGL
jgi:hypothetical protein